MATDASPHAELLGNLSLGPPYEPSMIHYPPSTSTTAALPELPSRPSSGGELDRLPLELLHEIFPSLDFGTLRDLRAANFRTRDLVDSFPAWRCMTQHASSTLRALADTQLIMHFSSGQLYATLRSDRCEFCNKYGAFLFLPTAQRICFNCHLDNPDLRVLTVSAAATCFGLGKDQIKLLPTMLSLPARYGLEKVRMLQSKRPWLVSIARAREIGIKLHGSREKMEARVEAATVRRMAKFDQRLRNPPVNRRRPREPLDPKWILGSQEDPFRFVASMYFPSVDERGGTVERGLNCSGCQDRLARFSRQSHIVAGLLELRKRQRTSYSRQEFLAHLKECPDAKRIWRDLCGRGLVKNTDAL